MKEGTKVFLTVIILFLIVAWIFVIYSFVKNKDKVDEEDTGIVAIAKRLGIDIEDDEKNESKDNEEYRGEIIDTGGDGGGASMGGGGASGGGGSSGEIEEQHGCYNTTISYALKEFLVEGECLRYDEDVCIERWINCSLDVYNLDKNVGGIFNVRMTFFEEGIEFDNFLMQPYILPNNFESISKYLIVESNGIDGRANKQLSCMYDTEELPKKEFCY